MKMKTSSTTNSISRSSGQGGTVSIHLFTLWVLAQIIMAGLTLGQTLTHGPVVGGVTAQTANVFVRTDNVATVALRYGTDPNLGTYQTSPPFETSSESDFTLIIPLGNLTGENTYYMSVVVNDMPYPASSPFPSFTTFPPNDGTFRTFNFVVFTDFVTTFNRNLQDVQTFASAAAVSPAPAFAFIGGDFDHRDPNSIDEKRRMFKNLYDANPLGHMEDFVNKILQKMPIIHQWDDHDAGENNLNKNYPHWDWSQQVFEEYVPSYPLPSVTPAGIWQKFSYAQADFFVLDCRSQRDPVTDPPQERSMLDGRDFGPSGQLQWLKNGLRRSTAQWKIIFTSVITNRTTKRADAWAAYQAEWRDLTDFIKNNKIQGVVLISGDLHLGAIDDGTHNGFIHSPGFPEMCVPQPNSKQDPPGCASTGDNGEWTPGYYNDTCSGFGLVKVEPDQLTLQVADEFGVIQLSYTVLP